MNRSSILMIAGLACGLTTGCQKKPQSAAGPPPAVPVTVAQATHENAPRALTVVGAVEASAIVEVKSQIPGQLLKVHFTEGQDVREGQLMFTIDPAPYEEALRQAQAAVERDRALIVQAQAAMERDIVQAKSAEADAARYAALLKAKVVSAQQELQYRTAAESQKEAVRADRAAIESARGSLKVNEAAVSQARLNLGYSRISAPISGRTGNLLVQAGNLVKVNDVALVVINRIVPAFVTFSVPEKHLDDIRRRNALHRLAVDATPRGDGGPKATGWLSVVDNTVDPQTGSIKLKATFDNPKAALWPGQFVDVLLMLDSNASATMVPSEAVQAGQQGPFVYVVKQDQTVEPRPVSPGRTIGGKSVIESGINPGETVVTDGQMLLYPGARIMVAPAQKSASVR